MSTIEDFKNAPVGATATNKVTGDRAMKSYEDEWSWVTLSGRNLDDKELAYWNYTLDPSAPTTAQEALGLAWGLAHEVKEGYAIPKGTRYLRASNSGLVEYTAERGFRIAPEYVTTIRTFDPLPDPKPDWLDAPAVLAHVDAPNIQPTSVFTPTGTHPDRWGRFDSEWTFHWNELRNVIPLYPLAEGTLNGTEAPKGYTPSNSMGLKNEEAGA